MSSFGDARVKLVAMADEATGKSFHQPPDPTSSSSPAPASMRSAISVPEVKKLGWTLPEWPGWIAFAGITFGFWALSHAFPLSPGGPLEPILPSFLVEFSRKYREQFFAVMLGIHVIEASIVAGKCLEVGASLPILVLWTVNGFFEGGPAIARVNKLIAKNKLQK
jgi:hypothetical protein